MSDIYINRLLSLLVRVISNNKSNYTMILNTIYMHAFNVETDSSVITILYSFHKTPQRVIIVLITQKYSNH